MNARELYRAGKLSEAVAKQNEEVRAHPADIKQRSFLSELLCIAGNLERADTQLETIERMDPASGPTVALIRQLIRAEKTRQEVLREGRAPDFLGEPPEHVQLSLRAAIALRAGEHEEATRLVNAAEEARPRVAGRCDGEPFDDFRDMDDFTAGFFEVLTSTGRHLLIPTERVVAVACDAPAQPLDLLWRPASMEVREGPEGKVFLPTVYGHAVELDDAARLGRRTDWSSAGADGAVRGIGLRTFLVGEEARSVLEIGRLEFDEVSA